MTQCGKKAVAWLCGLMMSHTWKSNVNTHNTRMVYLAVGYMFTHANHSSHLLKAFTHTETHMQYTHTSAPALLVSTADLDTCQSNRKIKMPFSYFRVTDYSFEVVIQVVFQFT